ncbi:MAG TPA: hypothetical protein VM243_07880 [Phycisphaerae bacterium]|nr:hypothetical protein [Phycisphaerae bacterium]
METLRRLSTRIQQQLALMTRSQQLAIGLCAVIILGSLLWLAQSSTRPQLEPLLDQPMSLQEMGTAVEALKAMRVDFDERGDRIYVKPEDRRRLQRELASQGALPQDTTLGFENLLEDQSPFVPESINRRNFLIALQNELAAVIASSADVSKARVFINDVKRRGLGALESLTPTASVDVAMVRGKTMSQAAVQAVADLTSGAVAGLEPHNIKVIVDGRPRIIPAPDEVLSVGLLEEKKKNEEHLEEKIHGHLDYIPGVKVAIAVELETVKKKTIAREYTDAAPKSAKSRSEESNSGTAANESGLNPNTGTALSASGNGHNVVTDESEEEFFPANVARVEESEQIPFTVKAVTASVGIPRSYFVSVYRAQHGEEGEPTDVDLKSLIDIEKLRVRATVKNVIGITDDDAVQVDWFPDLAPGLPGQFVDSPLVAGLGPDDKGAVAGLMDYGPQAGLVGLALMSLLMMVMLVRRSVRSTAQFPLPRSPSEEQEEYTQPLQSAKATEGFLVGQEVDEDTLRFQNLSDQVSTMVEENPETAADLIRRWAEQD